MRRAKTVLALSLALGTGAGFLARGPGAATAAPASISIAVVDVLRVCREAPGKTEIDAARKKKKADIDDWTAKQQQKLEDLRKAALMAPELQRRDKERAYDREKLLAEFDGKAQVSDAVRQYADATAALYNQVRGAINAVAAQGNYGLVLYKSPEDEALQLNEGSSSEFVLNVAMRTVLHSAPELDITQQVLKYLEAQRPPQPPPSPPAPPPPAPLPGK